MKNRLFIKRYTVNKQGAILAKQTIIERLRQLIYGKRYITTIYVRSTCLSDAVKFVYNIGLKNVYSAEWIDSQGNSVQIVTKGRLKKQYVNVGYQSKTIKSVVKL